MTTLPFNPFQTLRRLFTRPRVPVHDQRDTRADEERRYVAYATAEDRRLHLHLNALGADQHAQRELLSSMSALLWSYRNSVRLGLLSCDQATGQYRLRINRMGREFSRLPLPDPTENYLPAPSAFQTL